MTVWWWHFPTPLALLLFLGLHWKVPESSSQLSRPPALIISTTIWSSPDALLLFIWLKALSTSLVSIDGTSSVSNFTMFCSVSPYNFCYNSAHLSKIRSLLVVMLPSSSSSDGIITLHSSLLVISLRPFPVSTASSTLMVLYSLISSLTSFRMVLHICAYSIAVWGNTI